MLEQLSASFLIDACHFFANRRPWWKWSSLTTLVLTSLLLEPNRAQREIIRLLYGAACTAMNMPRLELMEIWNGRPGVAAVFRYQTSRYNAGSEWTNRPTVMTWRATWGFVLQPSLIRAWERVTYALHGNVILINREGINRLLIRTHAEAIHCLQISRLVMRPVSLRQIRDSHLAERRAERMAEAAAAPPVNATASTT
jgi:hypothetical protein